MKMDIYTSSSDEPVSSDGASATKQPPNSLGQWYLVAAAVVLGAMLWGLGSFLMARERIQPEITLGLLVTTGVLILLLALALIALAFRYVGLEDPKQALGLPEGSVRALLAIGLMLLVAIVSLYLYNDVGRQRVAQTTVSVSDRDAFVKSLPADSVVTTQPSADKKTVTIGYLVPISQPAIDMAKQLVTILGTLLSAVVAFYFGAATAVTAQKAATADQNK